MSAVYASRVLRSRAASDDMGAHHHHGAAFVKPRLYDFSQQQQTPPPPSPPCADSPCLLALQSSGVGWGVKKRVRYIGRHRAALDPLAANRAVARGDDDDGESSSKPVAPKAEVVVDSLAPKAEVDDDEEQAEERKVVKTERRKRKRQSTRGGRARARARLSKIRREEEEVETKPVAPKAEEKEEESAAEEEESSEGEQREVVKPGRSKRRRARVWSVTKRTKKIKREEQRKRRKNPPAPKVEVDDDDEEEEDEVEEKPLVAAPSGMVERWRAARYAAGEASLLAIMRARGACAGKPISRAELREGARKHIGDTGLLDHLLRHIAEKVSPGSDQRFRRRHNATGGLEYWLEPAGLVAVRREAGVSDPYWVPPLGWKPGDPVTPEAYAMEMKRKVDQLAAELAGVKRHMEQLNSNLMLESKEMKSEADRASTSREKYDCVVKANADLEKQVLSLEGKYKNARQANGELKEELLCLKEKYENVADNNTRLEQQMIGLSTAFLSLKDDLLWLTTGEEDTMELENGADPWKGGNAGDALAAAAMGACGQIVVFEGDGATSNSNGTEVRGSERRALSRKCTVPICEPPQPATSFQWPVLAPPSPPPLTPTANDVATVAVPGTDALANLASMDELYECMMDGGLPTPPSASSTNAAATKKLSFLLSAPSSLTQPSTTVTVDALQPLSGAPDLHSLLRHTETPACSTTVLDAGKKVGTELALATPSY